MVFNDYYFNNMLIFMDKYMYNILKMSKINLHKIKSCLNQYSGFNNLSSLLRGVLVLL